MKSCRRERKGIMENLIRDSRRDIFSVIAAVHMKGTADTDTISSQTGLSVRVVGRILRMLGRHGILVNCRKSFPWIRFTGMIEPPLHFFGSIILINLHILPDFHDEDFMNWLVSNVHGSRHLMLDVIIENCMIVMYSDFRVVITLYAANFEDIRGFEGILDSCSAVSYKKILYMTHSVGPPV